ncbi:hypothetical protein SAMN04488077_1354 [Roseovarius tolerans]|uniref:Uncharacterized protein n=1 Tax=Roseovarius tolerans TaxID=74031 RepID=A0A1H8JRU2_9RHOB|nr:hypothetical protein [Roseovarius tolerans]SEN83056.1 hypothetical protein SAMN04488077_1354 [Roseovarius tolerans]
MKLAATTSNATINMQSLKAVSKGSDQSIATDKTLWQSFSTLFWAYTEETGKAETKSFEGLL